MSLVSLAPNNQELIESFRKMLGPFLEPERSGSSWPPNWTQARYSPLPRLLDRDELDLIETVAGYRGRLYRIYLYLQFAARIRKAVFSARRLALLNLDGGVISFDRILRRDRELAVCLFMIYAAVPIAALKIGNASQLLETAAEALHELLKVRKATVVCITSVS